MTLVQTEPKKLYIRVDEQGWQPGVNTLLYLPLENDATDQTGNYNITNSNVTFNDGVGVFNGSNAGLVTTTDFSFTGNPAAFTFSFWIYHSRNNVDVVFFCGNKVGGQNGTIVGAYTDGNNKFTIWRYNSDTTTTITINVDERTHIVITSDSTTTKVYKNGTLGYSSNITYNISQRKLGVGYNGVDNANYFGGNLSKFIVEDKTRTDTDVLNYYNQTKGNYGL